MALKPGAFNRAPAAFRDTISKTHGVFQPESGRYHLFIAHACPWANRAHAVLKLKKLEPHIGVSVVHPTWVETKPGVDGHRGWVFAEKDGVVRTERGEFYSSTTTDAGPLAGKIKTVRDIYDAATSEPVTRSVPILYDVKTHSIVNNESSEIIRIFNSAFDDLPGVDANLDLYPADLREAIDDINDVTYHRVNNGVYKCGFARTQVAYEEAFDELFETLDALEKRLATQRYLVGDRLTEADVRLFMTLVRFDEVYVVYFKTNKRAIREYPNLRNYVRDLYQIPAIGATVDMDAIKMHYFTSHPHLNVFAIIPKGSDTQADLTKPHDRDRFVGGRGTSEQPATATTSQAAS